MTPDNPLSAPSASALTDFAWLIEAPGQSYLAARDLGGHHFFWTREPNHALRFWSKDQADLVMMAVRNHVPALFGFAGTLGEAWPREHGYLVSRPSLTVEREEIARIVFASLTKERGPFWAADEILAQPATGAVEWTDEQVEAAARAHSPRAWADFDRWFANHKDDLHPYHNDMIRARQEHLRAISRALASLPPTAEGRGGSG